MQNVSIIDNEHGFSLMEAIMAAAIGGLVVLGMTTSINSIQRQSMALDQKVDFVDIRAAALYSFANPTVCSCHLNPNLNVAGDSDAGLIFNSGSIGPNTALNVSRLRAGCDAASPVIVTPGARTPAGLIPQSIQVAELAPAGPLNEYVAKLRIRAQTPAGGMALKDADISLRVLANVTNPGSAFIERCLSGPASAPPPNISACGTKICNGTYELRFTNTLGVDLGNTSIISTDGSSVTVNLINPISLRNARVRVTYNAAGAFTSVQQVSLFPYMCTTQSGGMCDLDGAGIPNCSSPILFQTVGSGPALSGSVNGLTQPVCAL